ncbi:SGNH/GDSL hydrolase family protein [Herbiconiux sp. P15]|uniref:SGNH/GDSL hydrolase family protein n=1 Tax=Herbiconiux liukaitaii TaxID=3342799 RepID=UPI0035B75D1D
MTRYVFVGDSITDCGRDRDDPASLGHGYVSLLAGDLEDLGSRGEPVVVRNLGISGDRAVDLERRWEADVGPTDPDVLTLFVGVNDMLRRFDSDDPTSASAFAETYRGLLERARSAGRPRIVLVEPFFLPIRPEQRDRLDDLDPKRAAVDALACEYAADLVRLQGPMAAAAGQTSVAEVAPDGVHPTADGHRLIADEWLKVVNRSL